MLKDNQGMDTDTNNLNSEQRILSRKDEVVDNLSTGIIETFDASKEEVDIGKNIRLEFEDTSQVKKTQFELLGNLMEQESGRTHELVIVNKAGKGGYDTYSVGHISLDMVKYKSIKKIFGEVEIKVTSNNEDARMPYSLYKRLSSNEFLSEEEIQDKYNQMAIELDVESIIKRNARLY